MKRIELLTWTKNSHMGISVVEPERHHIDKVVEVLSESLKELGYKA